MRYASPCLDCEYRHRNCHSKCTIYIDFVESYKAAKSAEFPDTWDRVGEIEIIGNIHDKEAQHDCR